MSDQLIEQYRAVREAAGWRHLTSRGKIRVSGPDHISFLHAMISNEVQALEENEGRYGTFLTATGKIVADFFYYRFPSFVLIDIDKDLLNRFMETLEQYIIMDDVELEDISLELDHYSVQGPSSEEFLEGLFGVSGPGDEMDLVEVQWESHKIWWLRRGELETTGFELILASGASQSFQERLKTEERTSGIREIGQTAYQVLRTEEGIPLYGIDMSDKNYPMEARLDHALSLSKGCYIGQEVVARATHIGGVARLLTRLKIEDEKVPQPGALLLSPEGRKVGKITTAVHSLKLDQPIALAYVKRSLANPGEKLLVENSSGQHLAAQVVDSFRS